MTTRLRLPDRAILANLRHAMMCTDLAERQVFIHLGVPDVDPDVALGMVYAAEYAHAARRVYLAEERLHELLELQRAAEAALAAAEEAAEG